MRYFLLIFVALIALQQPMVAQVDNDDCANATLLMPGVTLTGQVFLATEEFGANAADGVDENTLSAGIGCFKPARTVWYKFRTNQDGGQATVIVSNLGCLGGVDKDADVIGAIFEVDPNNPCDHTGYSAVADLGGGIQSCRGFQQGSNADDFAIGASGLAPSTEYYVMIAADRIVSGFTEVTPAECDFDITVEGDVTGAPDCLDDISSNGVVVGNCESNGSAGSVTFSPKGSGNYRLLWEQVEQPEGVMTITGLPNGIYDAIIFNSEDTDCQVDTNIVIQNIATVSASFTEVQASCNTEDGQLTVTASGGITPYTYSWSANGQTTSVASALASGDYVVTVGFGNGCNTPFTGTVTEPNQLAGAASSTATSCNGTTDGTAAISVSGGVSDPVYSYVWSDGTNGASTSGLGAGVHSVTATDDANGCFLVSSVTVTEPTAVSVTGTITEIQCNGESSGGITLSATGGNSTLYAYAWSNGSNSQNLTFVSAGDYQVTATDLSSGACTGTASFTLNDPTPVTISFTSIAPSCEAANNGSIDATVSGGTGAPYALEWLGEGDTDESLSNIGQGSYALRATDLNSCQVTSSITLEPQVSEVVADFTYSQADMVIPSVVDFNNNSVEATVYTWDLGDGSTSTSDNPSNTYTTPGTYSIQLIAALSSDMICTDTTVQLITVLDTSSITGNPTVFTPDGDGYNDEFTPGTTGMDEFEVRIYNRWGELIEHWVGPGGAWYGYTFSGTMAPEGTYYYVVQGVGFDGVEHQTTAGYVTLLRGQ